MKLYFSSRIFLFHSFSPPKLRLFLMTFRYVGDEHGRLSVLKYVVEEGKLSRLPYVIPTSFITGNGFNACAC